VGSAPRRPWGAGYLNSLGIMSTPLHELTQAEYDATWHGPTMVEKTTTAQPVLDIWPYADAALKQVCPGECICPLNADHVYESQDGKFQHILIGTNTSNVYLVVVVNVLRREIEGHFLLDLGKLYGLQAADA